MSLLGCMPASAPAREHFVIVTHLVLARMIIERIAREQEDLGFDVIKDVP